MLKPSQFELLTSFILRHLSTNTSTHKFSTQYQNIPHQIIHLPHPPPSSQQPRHPHPLPHISPFRLLPLSVSRIPTNLALVLPNPLPLCINHRSPRCIPDKLVRRVSDISIGRTRIFPVAAVAFVFAILGATR
jgi:hypothetical protein